MGKVKELLYKEQNPQFDAEDAFDDYEPPWAGDEQLQEAMGNTEYESKLAELKADNEFLSFCKNALDSAYAEIKELKEENEIYNKDADIMGHSVSTQTDYVKKD